MSIFIHKNSRAFTLVEIIVSLAIFSIVSVVALGALVKIVSANKKAQTIQSAISNLNFALETMSREMRVGMAYHCDTGGTYGYEGDTLDPNGCALGDDEVIAFKSTKKATNGSDTCAAAIAYQFSEISAGSGTYTLKKAQQTTCLDPIQSGDFSDIISPSITITNYLTEVTDDPYQIARIYIQGYAGTKEKEKTYFEVQTAVSSRITN